MQYTSEELDASTDRAAFTAAGDRTGVCWDNAAAESFFAVLKNTMYQRQMFPIRMRARSAVPRIYRGPLPSPEAASRARLQNTVLRPLPNTEGWQSSRRNQPEDLSQILGTAPSLGTRIVH